MGRNQHPFIGKWIQPAVRILSELQDFLAPKHSTTRVEIPAAKLRQLARVRNGLCCAQWHSTF